MTSFAGPTTPGVLGVGVEHRPGGNGRAKTPTAANARASAGAGQPASRAAALLRLQRLAGNAAVGGLLRGPASAPPGRAASVLAAGGVTVQRSPGDIGPDDLLLTVTSAGTTYAWQFETGELAEPVVTLLRADPSAIDEIEARIAEALSDGDGPRHETPAYVESPPVADGLRRDLIDWPTKRALARLKTRLDARAAALRATKLRYALEQQLESAGQARPGEIAWRREVAALRGQPPVQGRNMFDAARADRFELALNILEHEAGPGPEPSGPLHTATLGRVIWERYANTEVAPPELSGEELLRTHSNAFLANWLPRITGTRFVPDGFDLGAFQPKDTMDPIRRGLVDRFIKEAAPQSMQAYLLDRWAGTAGLSPDQFLQISDISGLRDELLDHLVTDFMRWAPTQPGWRGAFWSDVGQRTAFSALATVVTAGRALQTFHASLPERFADKGPEDLTPEEYAIAANPFGYSERVIAAAATTSSLVAKLRPGEPLESNLLTWYEAVAQSWAPGTDDALPVAGLLAMFQALGALKSTVEEQKAAAKQQISFDLDTSFDRIAAIVRSEAKVAEEFLKTEWVPMLKAVALEYVTRSRDEMQAALANWPQYREQAAARFRICGHVLTELISKLESDEVESIELEGQVLTRAHLGELRTAREFMLGQAEALTDPEEAENKRNDMEEAVAGFEKVRDNIDSGEYEPLDYTSAVYDEARRRLGIDWYEDWATLGQALDRWVIVPENPFLAYAIARWQWEERVRQLDEQFLLFLALGLLTVASLVVPGAVGLVLTGIDIAVSIGAGIAGVSDAYDLLALARLDPDGKVRGVTVEMAEKALSAAWLGLGLSIVLAGGVGALWARLLYKARGGATIPGDLTRLSALMKVNPVAAEQMIAKVKDLRKVEDLLEITGDSLLLERMLAKTGDVRHLEYALMHGDPRKIAELLDRAGDAATLGKIFDHVADAATAERLLKLSDDAAELAVLVKDVGNPLIVERLLQWAPTTQEASRLLSIAGDAGELSRLSNHFPPDVAARLLEQADDAAQLNRLIPRMDSGPQQLRGVLATRSASEAEGLLNQGLRASEIEMGLGKAGGGAQPTLPTPRTPLPDDVRTVLDGYGIADEPLLQALSAHEADRIKNTLTSALPGKAKPILDRPGARWALDGAKEPGDFVARWEYLKTRFVELRRTITPARGESADAATARALASDVGLAGVDVALAADIAAVRKLAGSGWVELGGVAGRDVAAAVKASVKELTFGTETLSAYHYRKHLQNLTPELARLGRASPEAGFSIYLGDARRTVLEGRLLSSTTDAGSGVTNLAFVREVPEAGGVTRQMITRVVVRDRWALISTHDGKVL